ncbi:hypothetical protein N0V84_009546 [Fusarium piperis]|uniref:AB hydrolase-1 domain-containing protein n=1 Tax=Fusarium piperis TaxID=1435070 RepID=A0A9W8W606_9HYPO|nr:hypothetical protein N0V84_009546 [Fusarium piperis]
MFEQFEPFSITTQQQPEIVISGVRSNNAASGLPPLLLLHGYPQTIHIWHRVAPQLTSRYQVVIPYLRGYGTSSKPVEVDAYAKSVMAKDFIEVMNQLGFDDFYICAHDRGARVAHKLCVDHPKRVRKAMLLDICPTLAMFEATNMGIAKSYFHWFLMLQKEPLPEMMISANPRKFAELFMGGRHAEGFKVFDERCFEEYVKLLEDPAAVHGMCQDYRASATLDMEEQRDDLKNGRLIRCPLFVIWGKESAIDKHFNALEEWRAVTDKGFPVEGYSVDSAHYVPECASDAVVAEALRFFV